MDSPSCLSETDLFEKDRLALANLIPLGFDETRDGIGNVFEAADRILESDWLSAYVERHVREALNLQAARQRIKNEHLRGEIAVAKAQRGPR
jgi:hypothetical protein